MVGFIDAHRDAHGVEPIFAAIDITACHRDPCCPSLSRTSRTARSRTSGENLFVVLLMMLHPTQELEPPANPARFTPVVDDLALGKNTVERVTCCRTRNKTAPASYHVENTRECSAKDRHAHFIEADEGSVCTQRSSNAVRNIYVSLANSRHGCGNLVNGRWYEDLRMDRRTTR
jgi:hypothetical protein